MSEAPDETQAEPETQEQDGPEPQSEPTPEEEEAAESEEVEGQEGGQPEPEQPEAQALTPKQLEDRMKRLDKSSNVWRERVATIMESDLEILLPCPMCEPIIPGYVMPSPATPGRFPAVREFMGDAQPQEWKQDPNTRTCATCDGMGEVKTGSKVQSQQTLVCTDCGGKGWQGTRPAIAASGPMAAAPPPDANGTTQFEPPAIDPPDVAALKLQGYTVIPPVGAPS